MPFNIVLQYVTLLGWENKQNDLVVAQSKSSTPNSSNHFRRSAVSEYAVGDVMQNQGSSPHHRVGADSDTPSDDRPEFHGSCLLDNDPPAQMRTEINPGTVCDDTLMIHACAS